MAKKSHKGSVNPSVGLIYEVNNDLSFNASLNYATRSPRFHEVMLSSGETRGRSAVYSIASNIKPRNPVIQKWASITNLPIISP